MPDPVLSYVLKSYLEVNEMGDAFESNETLAAEHQAYVDYIIDYYNRTSEVFNLPDFFNQTGWALVVFHQKRAMSSGSLKEHH